jgi:hypothetical protein
MDHQAGNQNFDTTTFARMLFPVGLLIALRLDEDCAFDKQV